MPELPDVLSFAELGSNKSDYFPVEDITTDRSSTEVNKAFAAISMMSHTSIKAFVKFNLGSTPQIADGYTAWDAQWKSVTPTPPIVTKNGTGVFTITFPTQVQDDRANGELHTLVFKTAVATFGGQNIGIIKADVGAPNVITISVYNTSFSLNDFNANSQINVWII